MKRGDGYEIVLCSRWYNDMEKLEDSDRCWARWYGDLSN